MALEARKARLFVPEWGLRGWYYHAEEYPIAYRSIAIAYDKDLPIGACLLCNDGKYSCIGVFVKKEYRLKGIGKKLVKSCVRYAPKSCIIEYVDGVKGSRDFYKKVLRNHRRRHVA